MFRQSHFKRNLLMLLALFGTSNLGYAAVIGISGTVIVYAQSLGTTSTAPFPIPNYVRKSTSETIVLPNNDSSTQSSSWGYGGGGASSADVDSLLGAILFSTDSSVKKHFTSAGGELGQAHVDFDVFFTITGSPATLTVSSHGNISASEGFAGTTFYLRKSGIVDPIINVPFDVSDFDNHTYQVDPGTYELKGETLVSTGTNPNPNWTAEASATFSVVPEISSASLFSGIFIVFIGIFMYKRLMSISYE